jgi:hypothetical protein
MASQEMLKKLLEEFDEKEAQNREEINIVNLRIEELEKRISSSQQRLQKVSLDRQKVAEMMNRYSNGNLKNGTFVPANFAPAPAKSAAPAISATPVTPSTSVPKPAATLTNLTPAAPSSAGEQVPASEWGIVKAAPPTPIIFDPSLPGGAAPAAPAAPVAPAALAATAATAAPAAAAAPLPFSPPSASPSSSSANSPAAGPSISSPVTSASSQAAPAVSKVPSQAPGASASAVNSPTPGFPGASEAQDEASHTGSEGASAGASEGAPAQATAPTSSSPISSLSAASLFASAPSPTTATSENSPFTLDSGSSSGASPFTTGAPGAPLHTTPLSTPQNALPQSLMGSMPIGGGSGAQPAVSSPSGPGKFDMMDLFAPLSGEEGASSEVVSEPAAEVAEQALAQNQFYSSPALATAGQVAQAAKDPSATGDSALSTATSDHPSLDLGEDPAATESEEGDDTVKSINDALRGLFR